MKTAAADTTLRGECMHYVPVAGKKSVLKIMT